ncbi:uncharacterized protein LOC141619295 [Silene latifolia]|uniref:uncharacterized protein LOC141619295 n=1 Tax=Silene latifolia TaxID=37657 RepID=UPI003D773458
MTTDAVTSPPISPYFLSTSDKLGDKVIQVVIIGNNYDEWSVNFRGARRARKKTVFIDGTIKKHAEKSETLEDWHMVNAMVVNWFFNIIEPTLGSAITYVNEAKVLWDDMELRFSVGNGPKLHIIKSSICSCKQGGSRLTADTDGTPSHGVISAIAGDMSGRSCNTHPVKDPLIVC